MREMRNRETGEVEPAAMPKVARNRGQDPEVIWRYCARIEPGTYQGYSRTAKVYRDARFKRWVCAVQFDVLTDSLTEVVAQITWYLNLGSGDQPRAGRRGNYWQAWVNANGRLPQRRDRLSPQVFVRRHATIEVADAGFDFRGIATTPEHAYSVVRNVIRWHTGEHRDA
jgi:hypothetical protein